MRAEADRLHRLVEDLLVLSRVEHDRLEVEAEPIEPRRLLERIVAWGSAELPSIEISLDLEPYLPIVAGEVTYVEQIVRNLLNNAAKYTPTGTKVVVSARTEDDGIAIRVSDEGPGIPEGSVARAFELFYRDPDQRPVGVGIGHRALRLCQPRARHGRPHLGPPQARGRVGVRLHAARHRG